MRKIVEDPEEPFVFPDGVTGPFEPVTPSDIDWFNSLLADEIDSALTSSIRCCDRCFDDFEALWPGTTFRNLEFQHGFMLVEYAVGQSRLPDVYTRAQIATLRHFVRCPRCSQYARTWIWVHEHAAADALEGQIEQVGTLARRTPFLVLEDAFARRVLAEVKGLGLTAVPQTLPCPLYRARAKAQMDRGPARLMAVGDFGPPPEELVVEGRFNHAGLPMLYLADSIATTVAEIGAPGEQFYVAALDIAGEYKILDLIVEDPDSPEWELLGVIAASALMAAPRTGKGWVRKEYIFTRFVADCAIAAGFDGIRYGSTKHSLGFNYVLLSPPMDISTVAALAKVNMVVAQ